MARPKTKSVELEPEVAKLLEEIKAFTPKARQFIYIGTKGATPVSASIANRHTRHKRLTWFDPIEQVEKELRYCTNQKSVFAEEQEGPKILGDILFIDGVLNVPRENVALQKFLLFYHPDRNIVYKEFDPDKEAEVQLNEMMLTTRAKSAVFDMDMVDLEAIARVVLGSSVDNMRSGEIRRDMAQWAGASVSNAKQFEQLADDKDIKLRNLARRAIDAGILKLSDSGTSIRKKDEELVIKVPFGENPLLKLAAYFQTDEGLELMDYIGMKLNS